MISRLLLFIVIVIVLFTTKVQKYRICTKTPKEKRSFYRECKIFFIYIIRYQIFFVILQTSRRRGCFLKEAVRLSMRQKTDINGK